MLKCKYAWSHLDFTQGQYAPCFRFKVNKQPIAKITDKLPSEVINSDEMKEVRKSLQQGVFPKGCSDCEFKEGAGLTSYRQQSMANMSWDKNNEINYESTEIKKVFDLELKLSRTCNFLCRHCNSDSNSSFELLGKKNPEINNELLNFGFQHIYKADSPIIPVSKNVIDDIIVNIAPTIEKFFFSGGEPLYHIEHYRFLERLISEQSIDTKKIILGYNTNLSMIKFKKYDLRDLWKHFKAIELTVSLDGTGRLFNYFREKGDYTEIVNNLFTLVKDVPNITSILLVCTCAAYHAFYADIIFKDIVSLLAELEKLPGKRYLNTKPTFVHTPGLDMLDLEKETKEFIITNLKATLTNENNLYNKSINEIIQHLRGNSKDDSGNFKNIVKAQDKLYNKNAKVVPRIYEYIYHNKLDWIDDDLAF